MNAVVFTYPMNKASWFPYRAKKYYQRQSFFRCSAYSLRKGALKGEGQQLPSLPHFLPSFFPLTPATQAEERTV